ncbi:MULTISPECIES: hypothetical protein [unclassified Mesorhizobium]|uniref:hypothetical protein n=1 Tax=unclassified Mesorhizobium TaxID=325217 RepID=UPI000FD9282E|nr:MULTISPECIES: hypothetical protein [unclassified Mesorhizobium]TGR41153.1 hypothetical protein EN842_35080 [bacterium M00.F.Ca.ET.199.01.1.1]TGU32111.1 hypothetical protein EN799_28260 [bacterium M00.F.Ca.ET.156.01.1.1]TGV86089.1 hypothetical protein EN792_015200 [Mesorhizobium sp. M00.F.Ca.ET.149.01.1.1]TGR25879.1 hypothetical protein EN840_15050 [Mesorhizobium sp. M8A.F.Ca.ET.197.01.1.1]TGR26329.1 hypothetical protein EN845_14850 [Mesorhizobium sp. M8A.F.Ca.ET.202.01.1.1]
MPITVTAPEAVLTPAGEREILPRLSAALIEASGAAGNSFFTAIVGGTVHVLPARNIYAGGANRPVVMVELKLPNIGLGSVEARETFITAAARIVGELCVPGHKPENTWINIVNAPDGGWGIGDRQYTGDALIAAATAAAH